MVNRSRTSPSIYSQGADELMNGDYDSIYKFKCMSLNGFGNQNQHCPVLFEFSPATNRERRISLPSTASNCYTAPANMLQYSVVILGELSVGKSALCRKYFRTGLEEGLGEELCDYDDINEFVGKNGFSHHIYERPVVVGGVSCKIRILDVNTEKHLIESGAEDDVTTIGRYAGVGDGCIVTYAVTDRGTFKTAAGILRTIMAARGPSSRDSPLILVGNKCDLVRKRQVSTKEGIRLAERYNVKFVETSASLNQNVDGLFEGIISQIHLRAAPSRSKSPSESSASSSGVKSAELLRRFRGSVITTINGIRKLNRLSQSSSDGAPSNSEDREFVDDDDVFTTSKPNDYVEMPETENPGKIRKLIRRLTGKKLTTRQNCQNLSVL